MLSEAGSAFDPTIIGRDSLTFIGWLALEDEGQESFARVLSVLCLVPHDGVRTVYDIISYFFSPVRRETVEEYRVGLR